jgi:hypothetical protein
MGLHQNLRQVREAYKEGYHSTSADRTDRTGEESYRFTM